MREIRLSKRKVALVDDADYEWLSQTPWHAERCGGRYYATHRVYPGLKRVSMHRLIMGFPEGLTIDHIDGNGLNNCRSNLRICSVAENVRNKRPAGKRKFKGVYPHYRAGLWKASITGHGVTYRLNGPYSTEEDAARAYDEMAKKLHGAFARLNFPDEDHARMVDAQRRAEGWKGFGRFLRGMVSRVSGLQHKSGKLPPPASMG